MKTKLTVIFVTLVAVMMLFSGCSSRDTEYAAALTKDSKVITRRILLLHQKKGR